MTSAPPVTAPAVPLSDRTLADLPPEVSTPGYDRAALRPGIVHIGVGGFHRAHQAVAIEDSVNGARSAVAAGYATIGILQFVPQTDRQARAEALREVGVADVVESWADAEGLLR
jgi:beta-phosphoglucomutase-like phosphatase (HAD superfamily)